MFSFAKGLKGLALTCIVAATALSAPSASHASVIPLDVKVQINDDLVHFPDAQPFLDGSHRTQVPIRFVTEKLGYQVDWKMEGNKVSVTLNGANGHSILLRTGDNIAQVDGKNQQMETVPIFQDGRVFIPLRFFSETVGIRVQWDHQNYIAILNEDGQYHAPAWYAPKLEPLGTFKSTAYSAAPSENGGYGAVDYFGQPLKLGTVAVDPKVIPLGTKLYIEGYDYAGLPTGGMVVKATDTGGAIKGNKLDVFIPESPAKLKGFGIQEIKVYKMPD